MALVVIALLRHYKESLNPIEDRTKGRLILKGNFVDVGQPRIVDSIYIVVGNWIVDVGQPDILISFLHYNYINRYKCTVQHSC